MVIWYYPPLELFQRTSYAQNRGRKWKVITTSSTSPDILEVVMGWFCMIWVPRKLILVFVFADGFFLLEAILAIVSFFACVSCVQKMFLSLFW